MIEFTELLKGNEKRTKAENNIGQAPLKNMTSYENEIDEGF